MRTVLVLRRILILGAFSLSAVLAGSLHANPLVWYRFDDGSGTVLTDHSGNGFHGTLVGFPDVSAGFGSTNPTGWLTDGGLKFGSGGGLAAPRVETPFPLLSNLVNKSFTVEMVVSHTNPGQFWSPFIGQSGGCCFFIGKQSGTTSLHHNLSGIGSANSVTGGRMTNGQPHHVALVYDRSINGIRTYLDYLPIGGQINVPGPLQDRGNLWLGSVAHSPINEFWTGGAWQMRISEGALAASQFIDYVPPSLVSSFSHANFLDTSQLRLNGSATPAFDSLDSSIVLRLTSAAGSQAGAAYRAAPVAFAEDYSFSTYFTARMHAGGGGPDVAGDPLGADGMTFVIHSDPRGPGAIGGAGGALAANNIGPGLFVELDTWHGGTWDLPSNVNTNGDHIAINVNAPGIPQFSIAQTAPRPLGSGLNDGTVKHIWVDYDGNTKQLKVFGSQTETKPASPLLQQTIYLDRLFNTRELIVGFTAGTGGAINNHDIRRWDFTSSPSTSTEGPPPPPPRDYGPVVDSPVSVNLADMTNLSAFTLVGNAIQSGDRLRLTQSVGNQGGAAWLTNAVRMPSNYAFNAAFSFEISAPGGSGDVDGLGADGMTFAIQADPRNQNAIGGLGGALALDGVFPQVSVEIDTWHQGSWDSAANTGVNGMHIAINQGTGATPSIAQFPAPGQPSMPRLNDGGVNFMWVDYDGTTMDVYLLTAAELEQMGGAPVKPAAPLLSAPINLATIFTSGGLSIFGSEPEAAPVRFGFTAATGGAFNNHDVLSFQLQVGPSDIPGDTNLDGVVNRWDAVTLARNWGRSDALWETGDFNNDQLAGLSDLRLLQNNLEPPALGGSAVPEPSSLMLTTLAAVCWFASRRGRRRARRE